jgi:hypothetical protein
MAKAIFSFNGQETIIPCVKEDKMKNICNKFASTIEANINSLLFINNGTEINLELTFEEIANSVDKNMNIMNILVFKQDENRVKCQDNKIFDNLKKFNQNEMLKEIKSQIETIINTNEIDKIQTKIKMINILINNLIEENIKNGKEVENMINNMLQTNYNINNTKNMIKGNIYIEDTEKDVTLFKQYCKDEGIDVYLNNEKIEIIKEYKIKSNIFKEQKGNYEFKIYFNNKLVNLKRFFENC